MSRDILITLIIVVAAIIEIPVVAVITIKLGEQRTVKRRYVISLFVVLLSTVLFCALVLPNVFR